MEQRSRLNKLETKGIPCTQGEDCAVILKTVAIVVECPISSSDIDAVQRVAMQDSGKEHYRSILHAWQEQWVPSKSS